MATALKKNCSEIDKNTAHLRELEMVILNILDRSGVCYRRNGGPIVLPGNLSLSFKEKDGEAMLHRLDLMGISVSTGSACDSKNNQISHVLKAIGADDAWARGTVRITLGKENTIEEAERIANALVKIAE